MSEAMNRQEDGKKPQYARARATAQHFGIGISTLWLWTKRPGWPKPLKAGPKVTLFDLVAIQKFLDEQQVK